MQTSTITVKTKVLQEELKADGVTVLTYQIEYPVFQGTQYQLSLMVINNYYKTRALEYQSYVRKELFPQAVEQYENAVENGFPVIPYEVITKFNVTYQYACILSLYTDKYEFTGGAHGNTIRSSQTWNLQGCRRLRLAELFGCGLNPKTYILEQAKKQIAKEPEIYFENYEELLEETFNEKSFYCSPRGIVVYYQQYDIAPYSSGIREFLIPYTRCVFNPSKTCFRIFINE